MHMALKIANLSKKSVPELEEIWTQYFDYKTKTKSREFFISRIAYRMQELEYGAISNTTKNLILKIKPHSNKSLLKIPPVGSRITKIFKGEEHCIKVIVGGFDYNGLKYKSLSSVAFAITGKKISGFRFFGLDGVHNEE